MYSYTMVFVKFGVLSPAYDGIELWPFNNSGWQPSFISVIDEAEIATGLLELHLIYDRLFPGIVDRSHGWLNYGRVSY